MEKVQLTQNEFSKLMNVNRSTLWLWIKQNKIPQDAELIVLPSGSKRFSIQKDYPGVQDILNKRS